MQCCIWACLLRSITSLKQQMKASFIAIKPFFIRLHVKKKIKGEALFFYPPSGDLPLNCEVYCLILTKCRKVTMGSISVGWHHPRRRERWNSCSLCAWYKWFGLFWEQCLRWVKYEPVWVGLATQEEKNLQNKGKKITSEVWKLLQIQSCYSQNLKKKPTNDPNPLHGQKRATVQFKWPHVQVWAELPAIH